MSSLRAAATALFLLPALAAFVALLLWAERRARSRLRFAEARGTPQGVVREARPVVLRADAEVHRLRVFGQAGEVGADLGLAIADALVAVDEITRKDEGLGSRARTQRRSSLYRSGHRKQNERDQESWLLRDSWRITYDRLSTCPSYCRCDGTPAPVPASYGVAGAVTTMVGSTSMRREKMGRSTPDA